ncbi:MAG: ATPase [Methanobacterium sp.]
MDKKLLKSLKKSGVDTRFVSITGNKIYINNLKLSRFSRKKEEEFLKIYPQMEVVRSKIFQKTCTRASRNLAHNLNPKEKIFLVQNEDPVNHALYVILEPYQRKYGIELILSDDIEKAVDLNVDSIASALTLDHETKNILNLLLNGEKIELLSSAQNFKGNKIIYPLINIREAWIYSWIVNSSQKYSHQKNKTSEDFLKFLETIIPDVRENIYKSALFISKNSS